MVDPVANVPRKFVLIARFLGWFVSYQWVPFRNRLGTRRIPVGDGEPNPET